ncbi:60S ribosomal protein L18 [Orobanche minor]
MVGGAGWVDAMVMVITAAVKFRFDSIILLRFSTSFLISIRIASAFSALLFVLCFCCPNSLMVARRFTETARARIEKAGAECLTFDQLALRAPLGQNTVLLRGSRKAREVVRHFGPAPGVPHRHTKPYVRSKGIRFENARGKTNSKVTGAAQSSIGIGNLAGGVQPIVQTSHGNEREQSQVNARSQNQVGNHGYRNRQELVTKDTVDENVYEIAKRKVNLDVVVRYLIVCASEHSISGVTMACSTERKNFNNGETKSLHSD